MLEQPNQKLGERLRELIAASDTQDVASIAKECGVSKAAVYGWFKTGRVHKKHLTMLAALLKTSIEGLLNEGAPKPNGNGKTGGELEWSFAAQKLAALFDHLPDRDRQLAWPWLVHMIAHSPGLVKTFLPYPTENARVEEAFGKAGGGKPRRVATRGKK